MYRIVRGLARVMSIAPIVRERWQSITHTPALPALLNQSLYILLCPHILSQYAFIMLLQLPGSTCHAERRPKYFAARAFFTAIFVVLLIAALSPVTGKESRHELDSDRELALIRRDGLPLGDFPSQHVEGAAGGLMQRDEAVRKKLSAATRRSIKTDDIQCRLVHAAADKCVFVRRNCSDEEAGLFSYLQLYYCRLYKAKPFAFALLLLWLGLLFNTIGIAASDFFCINLSTIASILGMSESMAGVTFLAFGNGSADVFSTFAAMKTHSGSLAVGELIGAAGFITAVVVGSMALVRPFKVARKSFVRDVGFFIVAASFSMVFLADGHLHLWECAVMVGFYVFYVVTVVAWHWYLRRRSRQSSLEFAARSQFHIPGADEAEHEEYHDEEDEDGAAGGSKAPTRTVSTTDFDNLERGGSPMLRPMDEAADVDDETRDRYLAEISSNMRVSRPRPGERRNTINPIRPSLVGALEFRSVLSSLQKSRNIQTIPINLRRYSDDPTFTAAQQQDTTSTVSNPEISYYDVDSHDLAENTSLRPSPHGERTGQTRARAVSANDVDGLRLDTDSLHRHGSPQMDLHDMTRPRRKGLLAPEDAASDEQRNRMLSPPSSNSAASSLADEFGYLSTSPAPMSPLQGKGSGNLLVSSQSSGGSLKLHQRRDNVLAEEGSSSADLLTTDDQPRVPRIQIPRSPTSQRSRASSKSSRLSPFPAFHDDPNFVPSGWTTSIHLPPSSIGSESTFHQNLHQETEDKPLRWWPYRILPAPQVLTSTLFPTLYSWKDKNAWEQLLGIVAAPSVFFLAITLPIVEAGKDADEDNLSEIVDPDRSLLSPGHTRCRRGSTLAALPAESPSPEATDYEIAPAPASVRKHGAQNPVSPVINISEADDTPATKSLLQPTSPVPHTHRESSNHVQRTPDPAEAPSSPKDWNRWLVATQIFTAPFFIVLLIWANTDSDLSIRNLLLPCLYALIGSLVAFGILVLTTTPARPPRYRHILCFIGFIVSIAWISTIANEVVGVLKAFGIILGISDAILGLTIFAVGNSLGDLVADITVARLGYPVMALSACFGGPMLNILLGIGISGLYMTIQGGERRHERHPSRPLKFQPYQIDVGGTLLISGITLLITLAGLLIVVPLRGWWIDRKVGWGLIALWSLSTIGNVVVEVLGWGKES